MTPTTARRINLGAGPGALPAAVLADAARAAGGEESILTLSHRSPEFERILTRATADVRALLDVPDDYCVLWMQGGASLQFYTAAVNLAARSLSHAVADYIITGAWSAKAAEEAARTVPDLTVHTVTDVGSPYITVAPLSEWRLSPNALFTYLCANETVHGIELDLDSVLDHVERNNPNTLIVADMSSNILSRPVDVKRYAIIFAGAQKNMGPAGVTLVIVRSSLLDLKPRLPLPAMLDYQTYRKSNSLYNTPPCAAIHVTGCMLAWMRAQGGIEWANSQADAKSHMVYEALKEATHFRAIVAPPYCSRMNIVFRVLDDEGNASTELESKFVSFALTRGISGLPGHRSVGGCRASLYNAISVDDARALVAVIKEFDALI